MTDTLSKIEKRTAYTLLLPAVFLVFAIVLFPIFANIWISFKEVQLKDIRIPEPRAKKIVKTISEDNTKLKIVYRLRNSSLIENIDNIKFLDKLPTNIEPIDLDSRCTFQSKKIQGKSGVRYGYAKLCGAVDNRQPIAVTDEDLDRINKSYDQGSGRESYSFAITVPRRSSKIKYICSRY